jgi:hypothetical protein
VNRHGFNLFIFGPYFFARIKSCPKKVVLTLRRWKFSPRPKWLRAAGYFSKPILRYGFIDFAAIPKQSLER